MSDIFHFLQSKAEALRSLFFDKPQGGAICQSPNRPEHSVHVTLPNGQSLMMPVAVTVSPVLDER